MQRLIVCACAALTFLATACTQLKPPAVDAAVDVDMDADTTPGEPDARPPNPTTACSDGDSTLCNCGEHVGGNRVCVDGAWGDCKILCSATGGRGACAAGLRACDKSAGDWGACSVAAAQKDGCTGTDDDCDGVTDSNCDCRIDSERRCDEGGKLFGPCAAGKEKCEAPGTWGQCSIQPTGPDNCELGNDNNCNGKKNENCPCIEGKTRPCTDDGLFGTCAAGTQTCKSGVFGACSIAAAAKDTCASGNDDSCNNVKNEGCECVTNQQQPCSKSGAQGSCAAGTQTCNSAGKWGTCSVAGAAKDSCVLGNDDTCDGKTNTGCTCIIGDTRKCSDGGFKGTCAGGTQQCIAPGAWENACSIAAAAMDKCDVTGNDDTCNGTANENCFDPEKQTFTDPVCIYRPQHPDQHQCGPAGSTYKAAALKTAGFCGSQYNQDGVFTVPRGRMEAAAFTTTADGLSVANPVPGVTKAYLVGGQGEYDKAAAGKVAVTFWWSAYANDSAHGVSNIHEYLYDRGELPVTIAIFLDTSAGWFSDNVTFLTRMERLKTSVLPALEAKWPKISKDPAYRSIGGQSTAGGEAFDAVWMYTDIVAKGIGGSASVACFTCLGGQGSTADVCESASDCRTKNNTYAKEVMFCPARPIRWTTSVGTCDIFGTLAERLAAGCPGGTDGGSVDASQCHATWPTINQDLADALKAKGVPYQLFKITGGGHTPTDWSSALPVQLRWAFKDITCAM